MKTLARRALGALLPLAAVAALSLPAAPAAAAETWAVDKAHSEASFEIRHFFTKVRGRFDDFSGTIAGDLAHPEQASVTFAIKAASINTNEPKRDAHLRSADFFDVEKFAEISFQSKSIKSVGKDLYEVTGPLTMHGVTKDVTLKVQVLGSTKDPWGNQRTGLEATTTLERKEFGIVWNKVLDAGSTMLGDDVKVTVNIEAVRKSDAPKPEAPKTEAPKKG